MAFEHPFSACLGVNHVDPNIPQPIRPMEALWEDGGDRGPDQILLQADPSALMLKQTTALGFWDKILTRKNGVFEAKQT